MKKLFTTLLLLISFAGFSQHLMSVGGKINLSYVDQDTVNWHASTWYGVSGLETSNPDMTRIGTLSKHVSLPVQSLMRGCVLTDAGTVNYYLKSTDWTKKADGTASDLTGTDGQVMVEIPQHWVCDWNVGAVQKTAISLDSIKGFRKIPKMYISAYKAALNRTTLKLSSVVNTTTTYRGGNNTSAWDAGDSSLLGKPVASITFDQMRTYARNRDGWLTAKWNMMTWLAVTTIQRLFMIEYATKNSQKALDGTRTAEGYKKGGLGMGVTDINATKHTALMGATQQPLIPCGTSNALADSTGEVNYIIPFTVPQTVKANRYRGIENPFGDMWEYTDGINIYIDNANNEVEAWVFDNPAYYDSWSLTNARFAGFMPDDYSSGEIQTITNYDHIITDTAINTNYDTYFTDMKTASTIDASTIPYNAVRHGGYGNLSATPKYAGLFGFKADNNGTTVFGYLGTRLVYLDIDKPAHNNIEYIAQYDSVYKYMLVPPVDSIATAQSRLVDTLVGSGVWAKCDAIYLCANQYNTNWEALINWVNPTTKASPVFVWVPGTTIQPGIPFESLIGFTGKAASYINTNINLSTATNYKDNNAHLMIVIGNNITTDSKKDMGVVDASNNTAQINSSDGYGTGYAAVYSANSTEAFTNTNTIGYYMVSSTEAEYVRIYKNTNVQLERSWEANGTPPNANCWFLGYNNKEVNSTPPVGRKVLYVSIGAALTTAQIQSVINAVERYMDSNGKGIIP
jgi:hypothetical protein